MAQRKPGMSRMSFQFTKHKTLWKYQCYYVEMLKPWNCKKIRSPAPTFKSSMSSASGYGSAQTHKKPSTNHIMMSRFICCFNASISQIWGPNEVDIAIFSNINSGLIPDVSVLVQNSGLGFEMCSMLFPLNLTTSKQQQQSTVRVSGTRPEGRYQKFSHL